MTLNKYPCAVKNDTKWVPWASRGVLTKRQYVTSWEWERVGIYYDTSSYQSSLDFYHVTQHPNHALIFNPFVSLFVLKYLHLSIFVFQQPSGPHTRLCLFAALSLKLFQGTSVRCVRPWRPLSLWHSTNSHQSGHMITEQYVTPPSPERPVLKSPDLCHKLKPQVIYSSFIYSMSCKSPFYWLMKYKILLISFWNVNLWKLLSSFQLESVSVYSEPKAGCGLWLMHVWITT